MIAAFKLFFFKAFSKTHSRRFHSAVVLIGLLVLLLACIVGWSSSRRHGADYLSMYLLARSIATRQNIYSPDAYVPAFSKEYPGRSAPGIYYPPSTGLVLLPLGLLSYPLSSLAWFALLVVSVAWTTRELLRLFAPKLDTGLWLLVSGLVLLTACMRWNMYALQGAPLIYSGLGLFVVALHRSQTRTLFLLTCFMLCFKATFALPLFGLLLLYRHYRLGVTALLVWVVLNAIGFFCLGHGSFAAFRQGMAEMEAPGGLNSPNPWEMISVMRLDWVYLACGIGANLFLARLLNGVLTAIVGIWLLMQTRRLRFHAVDLNTTTVFLLPWTCLTLLCVYHHHYDSAPLLIPLLMLFCRRKSLLIPEGTRWLLLPAALYMLLYPIAPVNSLLMRLGGAELTMMGKMIGAVVLNGVLIASLDILRTNVANAGAVRNSDTDQ